MELTNIIVDRIEKTVVFNIVDTIPQKFTHMRSVIDDDLINEYLHEINRFSQISNLSDSKKNNESLKIKKGMKQIGEAIYRQLIPEQMQIYLRMKNAGSIFFHIDEGLRLIPWELLHNGDCFLSDKFYIGRNINGQWRQHKLQEFERLNVLIVADPAENLEWARLEGEQLYENLLAEVSPDRIDLQYLAGSRVTKLRLLNAIEDRNVIHYAGHVNHDANNPEESGWVLSNNKILRAREIKKSGTAPLLVFSNSCLSSPLVDNKNEDNNQMNNLASAFLHSGIGNFIGTNWEIKDNRSSSEFALKFYKEVFDEKSVGIALYEARKHVSQKSHPADLTWANYVLHGNPNTFIYRSGQRRSFDASRLPGFIEKVIGTHPLPIARSYENFLLVTQKKNSDSYLALKSLCRVFENTLILTGAILFSRLDLLNTEDKHQSMASSDMIQWNSEIYLGVELLQQRSEMEYLKRFLGGLLEHKEHVQKLLNWYELISQDSDEIKKEKDSYLIGFQFYLDNLLSDLFLANNDLLLYPKSDEEILILNGNQIRVFSGKEWNYLKEGIGNRLFNHMNEICYLQKDQNILCSLHPYIQFNPETGDVHWPNLKLETIQN